jgi:hypothetical protein
MTIEEACKAISIVPSICQIGELAFRADVPLDACAQLMMARLKGKRFSQIFEYLDQDGDGLVDMLALLDDEALMETLDPEVRGDVDAAARVLSRRLASLPSCVLSSFSL